MLVVVCYDIPDNGRRNRLYKLLEGYGQAVQRSVFECDLGEKELRRLRERIGRLVNAGEDRVRLYLLCEGCVQRIEVVGGQQVQRAPQYYVV